LNEVLRKLSGSRGPLWLAGLATLLSARAIGFGFQVDDHWLRARALSPTAEYPPAWLWSFPPGRLPADRLQGFWSWWSNPRLEINFFRPLSSLLHWLEFQVWPDTPAAMMLVNVLAYAALVWIAANVYRRLALPSAVSALASLMFAVDEAHAFSVGWLAARNTVLACVWSLAALWLRIEAQRTSSRWLQAGSAGAVVLALASAEAGTWSLTFLLAYTLVFEGGGLGSRLARIGPQLFVALVWAALYVGGGFGLRGAAWYRELSDPLHALVQGGLDLPLWLTALFGPNLVTFSIMVTPTAARLAALPIALAALALLVPLVRGSKQVQFFALATGLGLCPLLLTVPQDRMVIGVSFASFGWGAAWIIHARASAQRWRRVLAGLLLTQHVWIALILFPVSLSSVGKLERALEALAREVEVTPSAEQAILVNSPFEMLISTVPFLLGMHGPQPSAAVSSFHALYAGDSALELLRVDARTLDVRSRAGWGHLPVGNIFCREGELPRVGEERHVQGMHVQVLELTARGLPSLVRFRFDTPLDDAKRTWLVWRARAPQRWTPPAIGTRAEVKGVSLIEAFSLDRP
jgi:hypothetical protein